MINVIIATVEDYKFRVGKTKEGDILFSSFTLADGTLAKEMTKKQLKVGRELQEKIFDQKINFPESKK